jgi:putative endonuclease
MGKDYLNLGQYGEKLASDYLRKQGYKILEKNFRARYSEIDIVALDGDTLAFVEVKTRFGEKYGPPEEAITPWKLKTLTRAAQYYKLLHPKLPEALRIDIVGVELNSDRRLKKINLIKNVTR